MEVLKNVGRMFYIIDPADSCFENVEDIPQYYTEVSINNIIGYFKNRYSCRKLVITEIESLRVKTTVLLSLKFSKNLENHQSYAKIFWS